MITMLVVASDQKHGFPVLMVAGSVIPVVSHEDGSFTELPEEVTFTTEYVLN